jgi:hypothetical protein
MLVFSTWPSTPQVKAEALSSAVPKPYNRYLIQTTPSCLQRCARRASQSVLRERSVENSLKGHAGLQPKYQGIGRA